MRFKLIACEILFREICHLAAKSPNRIDIEFLPKGLHDIGRPKMCAALQETLEKVDADEYDAVLLGYALCNGGVTGLSPKNKTPLVIPKAHDCITLFMGNRFLYEEYFQKHPGTYFKTTGWLERGESLVQTQGLTPGPNDDTPRIPDGKSGKMISFRQMVERYGEKNARYIWEQLIGMPHYKRMTFIEMGIEPNDQFEQLTRQQAEERNWEFDKIAGSLTLLDNLINGHWNDEDFLVVQPGEKIEFDYTGQIIRAV